MNSFNPELDNFSLLLACNYLINNSLKNGIALVEK
jgi:hypothetical protein